MEFTPQNARQFYEPEDRTSELQRTVWKILNAEEEVTDDIRLRTLNRVVQLLIVVLIVITMLIDFSGTTSPFFLGFVRFAFLCFTAEYGLKLWSCVQREGARNEVDLNKSRYDYATQFVVLLDLVNLIAYWGTAMLPGKTRSFAFLRSLRIVKVFHVGSTGYRALEGHQPPDTPSDQPLLYQAGVSPTPLAPAMVPMTPMQPVSLPGVDRPPGPDARDGEASYAV